MEEPNPVNPSGMEKWRQDLTYNSQVDAQRHGRWHRAKVGNVLPDNMLTVRSDVGEGWAEDIHRTSPRLAPPGHYTPNQVVAESP
eukprot:UN16805